MVEVGQIPEVVLQSLQGLLSNHLVNMHKLLQLFVKILIIDGRIRSNAGHQEVRNVDCDLEESEALQVFLGFLGEVHWRRQKLSQSKVTRT